MLRRVALLVVGLWSGVPLTAPIVAGPAKGKSVKYAARMGLLGSRIDEKLSYKDGFEYHRWCVEHMADLCIRLALNPVPQLRPFAS